MPAALVSPNLVTQRVVHLDEPKHLPTAHLGNAQGIQDLPLARRYGQILTMEESKRVIDDHFTNNPPRGGVVNAVFPMEFTVRSKDGGLLWKFPCSAEDVLIYLCEQRRLVVQ